MSEGTPPPENPYGPPGGGTPPPSGPGNQPLPGRQPGNEPPARQPGGYDAAPPPPPPTSYGDPHAYSPTEAISYGWAKFKANPGPLLIAVLVLLVVLGAIAFVATLIASAIFISDPSTTIDPETGTISFDDGGGLVAGLLVNMLVSLIVGFLAQLYLAGLIKGALDTVDGKAVSFGTMFQGWDKAKVLVAAIIVAVATAIGTLLCYLPGLIVSFLASYTMYFVVDKDLAPVEAIKESVSFITGNLAQTLVFFLLSFVVTLVGALLCGVGLLAAVPIVLVAQAFTYRRLRGEQVSAVTA